MFKLCREHLVSIVAPIKLSPSQFGVFHEKYGTCYRALLMMEQDIEQQKNKHFTALVEKKCQDLKFKETKTIDEALEKCVKFNDIIEEMQRAASLYDTISKSFEDQDLGFMTVFAKALYPFSFHKHFTFTLDDYSMHHKVHKFSVCLLTSDKCTLDGKADETEKLIQGIIHKGILQDVYDCFPIGMVYELHKQGDTILNNPRFKETGPIIIQQVLQYLAAYIEQNSR